MRANAVPESFSDLNMSTPSTPERLITPDEAAVFLRCSSITVKRLAREGKLPAHSVTNGVRKRWRFLLSELATAMRKEVSSDRSSAPLSHRREG